MTTSVPSVEDITNAFPTPITKITGKPNYKGLKNLKDQLKANAASIPTTLGGGTHGYLGLILSPAAYATIAATQFIEPIYPGQHPNIPAGTSTANTSTIVRRHTEDLHQWREFKNVNTTLKNQLLSTLDDIYIRTLKDHHVGYMNQSIRSILQHLFDKYGNITPLELEDNDTRMHATWDPNSPFDCLVKHIEDGQDYADDGGQPYTAKQLLCITYTLVFKTGLYFEDCKTWNDVLPLNTPGTTSKRISRLPNAYYATKCTRPNKPASIATLPNIHNYPPPNHQQNIKRPSST